MDMRLRFPELFAETGVNPYRLATRSSDRISLSTAYRLKRDGGRLQTFKAEMLDAICDVMGLEPGELWERDTAVLGQSARTPETPAVPKRKRPAKKSAKRPR